MDKDVLISAGIDYEEAMDRFAGSTDIYEKFLREMASMKVIEPLQKALTQGNNEEAFKIAHTLKGNFGNLSVKPLFNIISEIVDELKENNLLSSQKLYIQLETEYDAVTNAIRRSM
ncbi:MAG: Hpt domain-containing protein [Clostridia bacterium]|nr:Hpt domain-containing protein [Clostridia bacterium]